MFFSLDCKLQISDCRFQSPPTYPKAGNWFSIRNLQSAISKTVVIVKRIHFVAHVIHHLSKKGHGAVHLAGHGLQIVDELEQAFLAIVAGELLGQAESFFQKPFCFPKLTTLQNDKLGFLQGENRIVRELLLSATDNFVQKLFCLQGQQIFANGFELVLGPI
jgi:hypothetical protein